MGFGVDNENKPVPVNIPNAKDVIVWGEDVWMFGQEWGWEGFCNQNREGGINERGKLNLILFVVLEGIDMVSMFVTMVPLKKAESPSDLTFGKFLRWVRIWLLLSTIVAMD